MAQLVVSEKLGLGFGSGWNPRPRPVDQPKEARGETGRDERMGWEIQSEVAVVKHRKS